MSSFADYFSPGAAAYASYRPRYPESLFAWLSSESPGHDRAWDCATGSGQAAVGLAAHFARVVATDPSAAQLAHAERNRRIDYAAMTAERSAITSRSVDVLTVAQALHWFDRNEFYAEVRRVLRPGGLFAVWSYALGMFGEPTLDEALRRFYSETVGPYWPVERAIIDAGFERLDFPFDELRAPAVMMEAAWSFEHFAGYLSTWSAVQRATKATGRSPLPEFLNDVAPMWGEQAGVRVIRWPLACNARRSRGMRHMPSSCL
jgi:SAM-dependent methyltransferase